MMFMADERMKKGIWFHIPSWMILGTVIILVPIFVFWGHQHINKQRDTMTFLLLEKGAALIRSFEAGTRTGMMGMMGMHGEGFQLERLLMETAQEPDIVHLIVTDSSGTILADNDPSRVGRRYGSGLDLERISRSEKVEWRKLTGPDGASIFEVFRQFSPTRGYSQGRRGMMRDIFRGPSRNPDDSGLSRRQIIFVGLDMGPIEAAQSADTRHTWVMGLILLLIGFAGIVTLHLAHAYGVARTSLTRIKAFSDNVVENMPIGLLAIDADGRIASFNQTAETVLQVSSRDILGKTVDEVLPKEIECLVGELKPEGEVIEKEIECTVRNNKRIPMDVSVSLLTGESGTYWGHIVLFRDLTEIHELKKEVERTQRLASLGRLAAGIAHEIRNPLSSIKGFATYFEERYKDIPEDQKTAEIMVREVDRLNRVISQLLEFARPMAVSKRPTSLQTMIQHTLKMIERDAQAKKIKIRTALSSDIGVISIDPDRMNQVLLNLYLNAMEAMDDGGTLSVDLSRADALGRVIITVSDTGVGIKKEDLVHIFDPYFTTKQSGTGLGLAIVHKIIESHKGEVRVESTPGQGTTVSLFIPLNI
jgi:two-component system sensor histidine kinase HydH